MFLFLKTWFGMTVFANLFEINFQNRAGFDGRENYLRLDVYSRWIPLRGPPSPACQPTMLFLLKWVLQSRVPSLLATRPLHPKTTARLFRYSFPVARKTYMVYLSTNVLCGQAKAMGKTPVKKRKNPPCVKSPCPIHSNLASHLTRWRNNQYTL